MDSVKDRSDPHRRVTHGGTRFGAVITRTKRMCISEQTLPSLACMVDRTHVRTINAQYTDGPPAAVCSHSISVRSAASTEPQPFLSSV